MIRTGSLVLPASPLDPSPSGVSFLKLQKQSGLRLWIWVYSPFTGSPFLFFILFSSYLLCFPFIFISFLFFFLFLFLILFRYSFPTVVQVPKVFLWMFFSFYLFFLSFLFSFRVAFYFPFLFYSFYISPFIFSLSCHHVDIVSLGYILYILS